MIRDSEEYVKKNERPITLHTCIFSDYLSESKERTCNIRDNRRKCRIFP